MFNFFDIFDPIGILIGFGVLFLIFLIFREFFVWYWKINKIVKLLGKIEENTRKEDDEIIEAQEENTNQ